MRRLFSLYWAHKGFVGVVINALILMFLLHTKQNPAYIRLMGLAFFASLWVMLRDRDKRTQANCDKIEEACRESSQRIKKHYTKIKDEQTK